MIRYGKFKPTAFDHHVEVDDRENWLVVPCAHNRDSEPLEESNFRSYLKALGDESKNVEVHRFGHWGPGWFEIIIINPDDPKIVAIAESIEAALADYPVVDEDDFSELENEVATEIWKNCYDERQRIKYIRKNRSQFDFRNLGDLRGCVKGEHFCGYASELIG
jgi:hypothetical protein